MISLKQSLSNKSFEDKKNLLNEGGLKLDDNIVKSINWLEDDIERRAVYLAELAYDNVWII